MAMQQTPTLDFRSATLSAHHEGARPGISYITHRLPAGGLGRYALSHLTRNSAPLVDPSRFHDLSESNIRRRMAVRRAQASAIRLTGTIIATGSEDAIRDNWELHLIQLFYFMSDERYYAGQTQSDGYMCHAVKWIHPLSINSLTKACASASKG